MLSKFVVLSTQRSGSTWVIDMLNSHSKMACYGELLLQEGHGRPPFGAQDVDYFQSYSQKEAGSEQLRLTEYLNSVYREKAGISAVGIKLMYGQYWAYPSLHGYMLSNNIRIVHLIRKNFLDVIISKEIASAREIYHVRQGHEKSLPSIRLNTSRLAEELEKHGKTIDGARRRYSSLGVPYFEVFYEDLCVNQLCFDDLLEFLDVTKVKGGLQSNLTKIVTKQHDNVIENYGAVVATLRGTRFSGLLR